MRMVHKLVENTLETQNVTPAVEFQKEVLRSRKEH